MIAYRYRAIGEREGRVFSGEIHAPSERVARATLHEAGVRIVSIAQAAESQTWRMPRSWRSLLCRVIRSRRARPREEFYDALGMLLGAGLPLIEALKLIANGNAAGRVLRGMAGSLSSEVASGVTLSSAMRERPEWFTPIDVAMVEASEDAGTLRSCLASMATRQSRRADVAGRVLMALSYPLVVALLAIGVALFLGGRTLPDLARLLTESGSTVPRLTQAVITLTSWIKSWHAGFLLAMLMMVCVVGIRMVLSSDRARLSRRMPKVVRSMEVGNLCVGLSELLRAGVTFVNGLRLSAPMVALPGLACELVRGADRIEQGMALSAALADPAFFDDEFKRLLLVGEQSGELPDVLQRHGLRLQRSSQRAIERLASVLEPAAIIGLAVIIGVLVMAAALPLVKLQEIIS